MRFPKTGRWWLYPTLVTPLAVAYLIGPDFINSGPVFNVIGLSASVAIVVGVRRHRPAAPWSWYLLALGQALFVAGDVLGYNYKAFFGSDIPFPSIADPVYLAVYPVTVAGLLLMLRRRNPGRDWASLVDALIVTIGLALLSWVFLISPYAHDGTLQLDAKIVSMSYPLMDILVLGVAVRMAVGAGRRSTAYYLLIAGIGALLITDSIYGWVELHTVYQGGGLLDGGWIVYYVLLGSAALHPSMTSVSQAAAPRTRLSRTRIIQIAAAALIAPVVEIVTAPSSRAADAYVIGGAAAILFGLVTVRMILLSRGEFETAERERTMRKAQGSLVTATSEQEIVRAAEEAALMLAGSEALPRLLRVVEIDGHRCLIADHLDDRGDELRVPIASLPEELVDQLMRRRPVDIPNARAELGPGAPPSPAVVWPFLVQGQVAGVIGLLNASSVPYPLRNSLESLAGQVGLALESAALTEHMLRSQSEKRFSALVKHSSDVILVLAADTTVQYASPSVMRVLERSPDELTGRRLGDHMPDDDRVHVTAAMSRLRFRPSDVSELLEFRIRHRDGRWLQTEGRMTNLLANPAVGGIVVNLRDITERKEFEEQLAYQAFHDSVTQLANRALFRDRVEHALRRRSDGGRSIAVMFMDVDDFKSINDTFGHDAGDGLLRTIAARLEGALRVGDTVARLGGDEFGVLLDDPDDESQISEIAERLLEVVKEPVTVGHHDISVQCSIGVAVSHASLEFAGAVDDLLRNADVAMYAAKATGGDAHRYFETEMHESAVAERELRDDLKVAIDRDELTLAYQPIFVAASGEIFGYEALLRWHHADRGPVSPASFIPIAEHSGLILPLGRWVLERACSDAVAFERACPGGRPLVLSVNISARQLQRPEIVEEVRDALTSSGFEASRLVLEVTESMMIEDLDLAISRLGSLRELGVLVAVDDFGTGYSSLNYIRRLPVDILKIDKSFIDAIADDHEQTKLTGAIIDLARALGLQCVAEGIEQPAQLALLVELGCDYGQGYLLARPMDPEALRELLRGRIESIVDA